MAHHQVFAALGDTFEFAATTDTTAAGGTLALDVSFPLIRVNGTGGVTKVLPDSGFFCLVTNSASSGTITLNDADANRVAIVEPLETALCIRVGASDATADTVWHAMVLKVNAT